MTASDSPSDRSPRSDPPESAEPNDSAATGSPAGGPPAKAEKKRTADASSSPAAAAAKASSKTAAKRKSPAKTERGKPAANKKAASKPAKPKTKTSATAAPVPAEAKPSAGAPVLRSLPWPVMLITALLAGLIGAGAAALWTARLPSDADLAAADPVVAARLTALQNDFEALQSEARTLAEANEALAADMRALRDGPLSETRNTLSELSDRISGLEQAVSNFVSLQTESGEPLDIAVIVALQEDVAALRADVSALQSTAATLERDHAARLAALEAVAPPADLDQRLAALAPRSDVAGLTSRIEALEQDRSGTDAKRAALALALAGLMRAADNGDPFVTELETIAILAPDHPGLVALQPYAASGLTRRAVLVRAFDDVARAVLRTERMAGAETWWQRLWANLRALITIRRTGDLEGDSTEAVLARVEQRLLDGDLKGASQQMHTLKDPAAAAAAPWLDALDARLTLDDFVSEMSADVLAGLGRQK